MRLRDHRPAAALLASLAVAVGLAACGSSDASGDTTPPPATSATQAAPEPSTTAAVVTLPPATDPEATAPPTTAATTAPATDVPATDATEAVVMTDAEIADLERQLDEIDQLLAGVDADLAQD
jgi:hypothetical protein